MLSDLGGDGFEACRGKIAQMGWQFTSRQGDFEQKHRLRLGSRGALAAEQARIGLRSGRLPGNGIPLSPKQSNDMIPSQRGRWNP